MMPFIFIAFLAIQSPDSSILSPNSAILSPNTAALSPNIKEENPSKIDTSDEVDVNTLIQPVDACTRLITEFDASKQLQRYTIIGFAGKQKSSEATYLLDGTVESNIVYEYDEKGVLIREKHFKGFNQLEKTISYKWHYSKLIGGLVIVEGVNTPYTIKTRYEDLLMVEKQVSNGNSLLEREVYTYTPLDKDASKKSSGDSSKASSKETEPKVVPDLLQTQIVSKNPSDGKETNIQWNYQRDARKRISRIDQMSETNTLEKIWIYWYPEELYDTRIVISDATKESAEYLIPSTLPFCSNQQTKRWQMFHSIRVSINRTATLESAMVFTIREFNSPTVYRIPLLRGWVFDEKEISATHAKIEIPLATNKKTIHIKNTVFHLDFELDL